MPDLKQNLLHKSFPPQPAGTLTTTFH